MVEIVERSLVSPSEKTPKKRVWLSNFDLNLPPTHYTPIIYLYESDGARDFFSITTIKKALAKALVPFYPLAGRFGTDKDGRLEINCNGDGALFVVAQSKLTLDQFKDFEPSVENRKLFVPVANSDSTPLLPLLMLQVTFLACGSVVLGLGFNHCIVDAHSDFHFMQALTNIARGNNTSVVPPPFLDRTLLRARSPPVGPSKRLEELHIHYTGTIDRTRASPPFTSTILKLSQYQIDYLKRKCLSSSDSTCSATISTFQAVSAHIWKASCIAQGLAHDKESRLFFAVGIRSRMSPPLPKYYFGNGCTSGFATARVSEIVGFIPLRIKEAVHRVDDAYVRAYIDDLEAANEDRIMKRIPMTRPDMYITSWLGMPCYDADFGYGNPVFVARAETGYHGVAVLINNPGKDGISVAVELEKETMDLFKTTFYDLN